MTNPDRWLLSCAEDAMDDEYSERFDDEYCEVERRIARDGVTDSEHDFADTMYQYASRVMQAIAQGDDVMTLMLVKEVYKKEINGIVERSLEP
jgi:23S rRNA pseudoU1915 N3-methylase RlmH